VATYWDSSAVLEVLFAGSGRNAVAACWDDPVRVTSTLLEAESVIVLRRAARRARLRPEAPALQERLAALDEWIDAMIVRDVDREVIDIVRRTASLADCRSLDGLHLATALLFRQHLDEPLRVCALDGRLRHLAAAHGFPVVPAA
jgi:predicted nucleic acid-binding protein